MHSTLFLFVWCTFIIAIRIQFIRNLFRLNFNKFSDSGKAIILMRSWSEWDKHQNPMKTQRSYLLSNQDKSNQSFSYVSMDAL